MVLAIPDSEWIQQSCSLELLNLVLRQFLTISNVKMEEDIFQKNYVNSLNDIQQKLHHYTNFV